MFRPSGLLGSGIGKIVLQESTIGTVMFKLSIEIYTYPNNSSPPPSIPVRYEATGMISDAHSAKANYTTRTMVGSTTIGSSGEVFLFNAAKLTPWDSSSEKVWEPSSEVKEGFDVIFGKFPLKVTSHKERAIEKANQYKLRNNIDSLDSLLTPFHIDLSRYKVGDIDGVYYIPDYISKIEEEQMLIHIKNTPDELKTKLQKRTVQEWGCVMCPTCSKSFVADTSVPPWSQKVFEMLTYDGIFSPSIFPNNVRIHEYEKGEGIAPHVDGPIYVPLVATISLASTSVMYFYPKRDPYTDPMEHYNDTFKFDGEIAKQTPHMAVVMEPRSLLIFKGDAYNNYPHSVSDKHIDVLSKEVSGPVVNRALLSDPNMTEVKRDYRVGVTVRNLLPRCNHDPQRNEYCMKEAFNHYYQGTDLTFTGIVNSETDITESSREGKCFEKQTSCLTPDISIPLSVSQDLTTVKERLNQLSEKQDKIIAQLNDIQAVLGYNTTTNVTFQRETSSILNYMSQTLLDAQSEIEDIKEKQHER
eukprot:Tbor_TRINITY_DN7418_c0_g1::TRINITY_DN7418_c0_g1_i1::g.14572::m.14572/K10768/ALKBH6; alkylated DNA repair protein alkB homolog 6